MNWARVYHPNSAISLRESQARKMSVRGWITSTSPQRKVTEEASDRAYGSPARGRGRPRDPRTKPAGSLVRGWDSLAVNSDRTPVRGRPREPPNRASWISSVSYHRYLPCSVWGSSSPPSAFLIHVEPGAGARMANGREGKGWNSVSGGGGGNVPVEN